MLLSNTLLREQSTSGILCIFKCKIQLDKNKFGQVLFSCKNTKFPRRDLYQDIDNKVVQIRSLTRTTTFR